MSGIVALSELLQQMAPVLDDTDYVFCSMSGDYTDYAELQPLATFAESEGLTLIVRAAVAQKSGITFEGCYRRITLTVHSSLDAVGLTAAVATQLASDGISANVVAAYYHDHIFVQSDKAAQAMESLQSLVHSHRHG